MKNLPYYVMAISTLLFACESSSDGTSSAGGTTSSGAMGGTTSSSGGSSSSAGGTTSATAGGTTAVSTAPAASGLAGNQLVTEMSDADTAILCKWIEDAMGLVRGATEADTYVAGTWHTNTCQSNFPNQLWGSPARCAAGISTGNAVGCNTLTVSIFEGCINTLRVDLCRLETADACTNFNTCFPELIDDGL